MSDDEPDQWDDSDRQDDDSDRQDDDSDESVDETVEDSPAEATDPFERLDAPDRPRDRDSDPFAAIDETVGDDVDPAADPPDFDDLGFERPPEEGDSHAPGSTEPTTREDASAGDRSVEPTADDPFDRVAGDRRQGDPFDSLRETAGDRDPGDAFDDDLWDDLSQSMAEPETEERGERRFAEVNKHSYCENCEYVSEPPDIECAHEGTDIIEFVDYETVRVADCPIVAEREELAEMDADH